MTRKDEFQHLDINRIGQDPYYNDYPTSVSSRGIWIALIAIVVFIGSAVFLGSFEGDRVAGLLEADRDKVHTTGESGSSSTDTAD